MDSKPKILIETVRYSQGKIPLWKKHVQRLKACLEELGRSEQYVNDESLLQKITYSINQQPKTIKDWHIRIIADCESEFLKIDFHIAPFKEQSSQCRTIGISQQALLANRPYSYMKSNNRCAYNVAKQEAKKRNLDDVILMHEKGYVVETSIANVLILSENKWITPPIEASCINGVMRSYLLDNSGDGNLNIVEKYIYLDDLFKADEILLCNALRWLMPVIRLEDRCYSVKEGKKLLDEITKKLTSDF